LPDTHEGQTNISQTGDSPLVFVSSTKQEHSPYPNKIAGNDEKKLDKWGQLSLSERCMILLTFGIVVVAGVTGYILAKQLSTMAEQTEILGIQAQSQAAGSSFSAVQTQKQLKVAQDNAETANQSLKASVESFRIDERAWIEIEPIKPQLLMRGEADTGDLFTCNIYLRNLGKTVATNISVRAADPMSTNGWDENAQVVTKSQDRIPKEIPSGRVQTVLAPNEISAAPFRMTCQAPQTFKSGGQLIHYLIGRINYVDQFQVAHWKRFCYFVVNNRGEIWNCREGNYEDKNPETPPN
jgi:hypothetical protein